MSAQTLMVSSLLLTAACSPTPLVAMGLAEGDEDAGWRVVVPADDDDDVDLFEAAASFLEEHETQGFFEPERAEALRADLARTPCDEVTVHGEDGLVIDAGHCARATLQTTALVATGELERTSITQRFLVQGHDQSSASLVCFRALLREAPTCMFPRYDRPSPATFRQSFQGVEVPEEAQLAPGDVVTFDLLVVGGATVEMKTPRLWRCSCFNGCSGADTPPS